MSTGTSTGSSSKNPGSAKHREHSQGRQDRDYTPEQSAAVRRIRTCKATSYYEILAIEKDASDGQIKKAYHKLSLATHPDKNGAPGADEAFKLVSKAFQVLSDPQKRTIFDQTGGDPEQRVPAGGGGGGGSPFAGSPFGAAFGGSPGGRTFQAEVSPEELFNMFFGGGGGMESPFGGGGFTFGGPGIRVHQFNNGRRRTRPRAQAAAQEEQTTNWAQLLIQLFPLLLFFLLPALTGLFSTDEARGPSFGLEKSNINTQLRQTEIYELPYWVNPVEMDHMKKADVKKLDRKAENYIINRYNKKCSMEDLQKKEALEASKNWHGFTYDEEKRAKAQRMRKPHCEKLEQLHLKRRKNA